VAADYRVMIGRGWISNLMAGKPEAVVGLEQQLTADSGIISGFEKPEPE
jgi:hypothetical protein